MPIQGPAGGAGGSGGGGFSLGPADNTFGVSTTANRAAAETLRNTYALANAAWLAEYTADRSFFIQLVWTGNASVVQRRNAGGTAWEDVTGIIRGGQGVPGAAALDGEDGDDGLDGAPGGGAISLVGTFAVTIAAANDDIFLDMGFDWPTTNKWIPYTLNGRAYWVDGDFLYGDNAVTASTAGTASTAVTRLQIPEPVTGAVYLGRTAANRALIEFGSAVGAITISIYAYIPSVSQGGGTADGVVDSAALSLVGQDLTLTLGRTVGADVVSNAQTLPAGGGGTATDLSIVDRDADSLDLASSTGNNVEVPSASTTLAGLQAAADKVKLDDIETDATADQEDGEIKTAYENNTDTNALTDDLLTILESVEANAAADQTGTELVTALEALTGTDRLSAIHAIRASAEML